MQRRYTYAELSEMRGHVAVLLAPELGAWDEAFFHAHSSVIEDRLRTCVVAGLRAEDTGLEVEKTLGAIDVGLKAWRGYQNAARA